VRVSQMALSIRSVRPDETKPDHPRADRCIRTHTDWQLGALFGIQETEAVRLGQLK